jgi:hypothetical protein
MGGGVAGTDGTEPVMRLLGSGVVVVTGTGTWVDVGTNPVGGREERDGGAVGAFVKGARIDRVGGLKGERGGVAGEAGAIEVVGGFVTGEAGAAMGVGRAGGWARPVAGVPSSGWVTAWEAGAAGKSTKRREPVSLLGRRGAMVPSGRVGRPVGWMTPDLAFASSSMLIGGWGGRGVGARGVKCAWLGATVGTAGVGLFLVRSGSCWVAGRLGDLVLCAIGCRSSGTSTLPLCTKTLALALATMTRGGVMPIPPDSVGAANAGPGVILRVGVSDAGDAVATPREATAGEGFFCGKRGVVFELAAYPVVGGAVGFRGIAPEGGFETLGIGLVTAVDQAGGVPETGASSNSSDALRGRVDAAEIFGRGVGMILVEAGLSGLGGRLMRNVSRFWALGSALVLAESAMILPFYSYFGKCSMEKFVIVSYLWRLRIGEVLAE